MHSVCVKDIVYIEISRRKIKIHCVYDELEIPYVTCEEILQKLDSNSFIQCSRYCIVNRKYIEQIDYTNRFIKLKYLDSQIEMGIIMKKAFKNRVDNGWIISNICIDSWNANSIAMYTNCIWKEH